MNEHLSKVLIIVGSTRPGRIGRSIAEWFQQVAADESELSCEIIDLVEWNLPFLDEPIPAKSHRYRHEHTRRWSAKIESAAGYVIVTPEYNHGYPAPLKNAVDFLYHEWSGKPVALVGYGWGGGRMAVGQLRHVLEEVHMRPLDRDLNIPLTPEMFNEHREIPDLERALGAHRDAARTMIQTLEVATFHTVETRFQS